MHYFIVVTLFIVIIYFIYYRHPRHKKYIKQICEEMWEARNDKLRPVLILYSLSDSRYMTLM
jgi:hypothetical protein